MQKKLLTSTQSRARLRSALALSVVLLFLLVQVTSLGYAVPQKSQEDRLSYVRIWIKPGAYPLLVDGSPAGKTNPKGERLLKLERATHTIEIQFPNKQRWKKQIDLSSGNTECFFLDYYPPSGPKLRELPPAPDPRYADDDSNYAHPEVHVVFSDGARLTGMSRCKLMAVPKVSFGKKKSTRKR